jgi:hypothetical protein
MCGRYTSNTEDEVIEIRKILAGLTMRLVGDSLNDDDIENIKKSGLLGKVIFPSQTAPVISRGGSFEITKWGFDRWDDSGLVINARSETADKSSFFMPYAKKAVVLFRQTAILSGRSTQGFLRRSIKSVPAPEKFSLWQALLSLRLKMSIRIRTGS